jgi:hypothetical protein
MDMLITHLQLPLLITCNNDVLYPIQQCTFHVRRMYPLQILNMYDTNRLLACMCVYMYVHVCTCVYDIIWYSHTTRYYYCLLRLRCAPHASSSPGLIISIILLFKYKRGTVDEKYIKNLFILVQLHFMM